MGSHLPPHVKPQFHPEGIEIEQHWSCEEPEHPGCINCVYSAYCQWCILKAKLYLKAKPETVGYDGAKPGYVNRLVSLRSWLQLHGQGEELPTAVEMFERTM